MPRLGYRKDDEARTYPVSFSLPGYIIDALDEEMRATGETSRSRLLAGIIRFWMENKPQAPDKDLIAEDLDRFKAFFD
ncbi:MAG: hypothetical protein IKD70_09620 [Eggerthellaceae bacterium]|nr:hypothetical protein [Eggerthellaceae bacterium]